MSQRVRKWLTAFAVALTVAALLTLGNRDDRPREAHAPAETGEAPGTHARLLPGN